MVLVCPDVIALNKFACYTFDNDSPATSEVIFPFNVKEE
jgi:hypothetical protein